MVTTLRQSGLVFFESSQDRETRMGNGAPESEKLWYLKKFTLFEGFTPEQMEELNRITRMESYTKDQPIYLQGALSRSVFLLKKGRVKISKVDETGKSITLAILEPGEIFGEVEALEGTLRTTSAQSLESLDDVLVCEIQHGDFERYLEKQPKVAARVLKLIGPRLRQIETKIGDLVFKTAPARLANLFLTLSESMGKQEQDGIMLRARLTHRNLADLIGTARETVSLILGDFVRAGLISQKRSYITILDKERLAKFK